MTATSANDTPTRFGHKSRLRRHSHAETPPNHEDSQAPAAHIGERQPSAETKMAKHQRSRETWQEANDALDGRLVGAVAAKDMSALLGCFLDSPDLVTVFYGIEMHGVRELRQALASLFSACDRLALNIDRTTRVRIGDVVIAVGRATYTRTAQGQDEMRSEVWTDVRRLVNGQWVYVLSHREALPGS